MFEGILGRPGSGKSEFMVRRALQLGKAPGCYTIAHDTGWRLPDTLHDGVDSHLIRYETVDEARNAIRSGKTQGIHVIPSADADPVVRIAEDCAEKSLDAHEGERGYPGLVLIDEIVAARGCKANFLAPYMEALMVMRRHKNVGVLWGVQSARLAHNQLLSMSTRLYIFRINEGRDLDRLREAGVDEDTLKRIQQLPQFEHVEVSFE